MRTLWTIARYTFLQQIRNRLYLVVALFAALMMGASVLLGALAADQEIRVILDLGLATTEIFGLVAALLGSVTLVLEEMETKTIYLILTRPLARPFYLVGRFLGLVSAVWASMVAMSLFHVLLLYLKGWETDPQVFIAFPLMALKIMVMTGLTVLCSLAFSSAPTATVFSLLFWVMGHFGPELKFMAEKSGGATVALAGVVQAVIPNLTILNLRDVLEVSWSAPWPIARAGAYAALYTAACLALASGFFSRKEF
jgi:ABC-type transport system involved in multi-copper enzyme maturation permease subunit